MEDDYIVLFVVVFIVGASVSAYLLYKINGINRKVESIDKEQEVLDTGIDDMKKNVTKQLEKTGQRMADLSNLLKETINAADEFTCVLNTNDDTSKDLERTVNTMVQDVKGLTEAAKIIEELETSYQKSLEYIRMKTQEMTEIKQQIALIDGKQAELKNTLMALKLNIKNLLDDYNARAADTLNIKNASERIQTDVSDLNTEIDSVRTEQSQLEPLLTTIGGLQTEINEILASYANASSLKEKTLEIESTFNDSATLANTLQSELEKFNMNQRDLATIEGKINDIKRIPDNVNTLKAEVLVLEGQVSNIMQNISTLQQLLIKATGNETSLKVVNEVIAQIQLKNQQVSSLLAALKSRIDQVVATVPNRIRGLETSVNELSNSVNGYNNKIQTGLLCIDDVCISRDELGFLINTCRV